MANPFDDLLPDAEKKSKKKKVAGRFTKNIPAQAGLGVVEGAQSLLPALVSPALSKLPGIKEIFDISPVLEANQPEGVGPTAARIGGEVVGELPLFAAVESLFAPVKAVQALKAIRTSKDASKAAKAGATAAEVGALSAGTSAARGDKPSEIAAQGAAGTAIGAVLPISGDVASKAVKALEPLTKKASKLLPPKTVANATMPTESLNRVQKLTSALKGAKRLGKEQEALRSTERRKRVAKLIKARRTEGGEAGLKGEKAALAGELPKVEFTPVRPKINQGDIDALMNDVNSSTLLPLEGFRAKIALAKVLDGQLPQKNEVELLNAVFGPQLTKQLRTLRSTPDKLKEFGIESLNVFKTLMSTADISIPFRQGAFFVGRPKQFAPAFVSMFKQMASEKAFKAAQQGIRERPSFGLMKRAGVDFTDIDAGASAAEEAFMSGFLAKLPVIRHSNRAAVGFLNKMRADLFDSMAKSAQAAGIDVAKNERFLRDTAKLINAGTGRGSLGKLEAIAPILNGVFYSPKLISSRLTLLNPSTYATLQPQVRKEAIKSLLSSTAVGLSVLGLYKNAGFDVGNTITSSDFGKIKVDNTRYDLWAGFSQPVVALAKVLSNKSTSATTGRVKELGEGFKPETKLDIITRYFKNKQAPVASLVTMLLKGQDFGGDPVNLPAELLNRTIPLAIQDSFEILRETEGDARAGLIPPFIGVGANTFGNKVPFVDVTPSGREKIKFRQAPSLGEVIAEALQDPSKSVADELAKNLGGQTSSNIPSRLHPQLVEAYYNEIARRMKIEAAKEVVQETGKEQKIGNTRIFIKNGILRTKTTGKKETPEKLFEDLTGTRLRR